MPTDICDSDKELLLEVADGSETAFSTLFHTWQPVFSNYVFRITKSKEITAEIVQDVFLKVWMNREALSGIENFRAYLFSISRNEALNALKKNLRELKNIREWDRLQNKNPTETDNQSHYEAKLSLASKAITRLSPRQKDVYLLHRHDGLTYQQIADRLGIGKESVKTHLELAVKSINKYLESNLIALLLLFAADF